MRIHVVCCGWIPRLHQSFRGWILSASIFSQVKHLEIDLRKDWERLKIHSRKDWGNLGTDPRKTMWIGILITNAWEKFIAIRVQVQIFAGFAHLQFLLQSRYKASSPQIFFLKAPSSENLREPSLIVDCKTVQKARENQFTTKTVNGKKIEGATESPRRLPWIK